MKVKKNKYHTLLKCIFILLFQNGGASDELHLWNYSPGLNLSHLTKLNQMVLNLLKIKN